MHGVRFYLEYPNKKEKRKGTRKLPGNHTGNVLAVLEDTGRLQRQYSSYLKCCNGNCFGNYMFFDGSHAHCPICDSALVNRYSYSYIQDAIGALTCDKNSQVCSTSVSDDYLLANCRHISESMARSIHPNLFVYLDD